MISVPRNHLIVPHNYTAERIQSNAFAQPEGEVDPAALPNDLRAILEGGHWESFRAMWNEGNPPWNPPPLISPKHSLPSNDVLVSGNDYERLRGRLIKVLEEIRGLLGGIPPIVLLDFFDDSDERGCFTTPMLKQALRNILGEDGYSRLVYDELRANFRDKKAPMVGNADTYKAKFNRAVNMPRLVIAGGTFSDADDVHGKWFQENIMSTMLEKRDVRALMICWSYQVMARAAAKAYEFPLYVINGALRWGAFPIDVLVPELARAAFESRSRVEKLTAGFTHSDHLIIPDYTGFRHKLRREPTDGSALGADFQVTARDAVTKLPAAYAINGGQVIGLAFHPEIQLQGSLGEPPQDRTQIERFMRRRMVQFLQDHYQIGVDPVIDNYAVGGSGETARLSNNPSGPLYAGILMGMAEQIKRELRHG